MEHEDWYVNFGAHDDGRDWEDARSFGFVAGGLGAWYSATFRKVPEGARIWVYRAPMTGRGYKRPGGYIGRGITTGPAVTSEDADFEMLGERVSMRYLEETGQLNGRYFGYTDPDDAEYVIPVRWERTASPQLPVTRPGLFTNRNTAVRFDVTKPSHASTLEFLYASFPVPGDAR